MSMGVVHTRGSIRNRLLMQLLAGAAILAVLIVVVVRVYARDLASNAQDNILGASVTAILDATAIRNGELQLDIPYSAFSMLGNVSQDRVFYAITRNGAMMTGYEGLPSLSAGSSLRNVVRFETAEFLGAEVRIATASRRFSIEGRPERIEVSVAQTRDGLRQTMVGISRNVGLFGLGFFVLAAFLGILATQSTVRPLQALARSVAERGPEDLRAVRQPVPSEMTPLVGALNGFIGRLKGALSRSEDLIAEAAHRVRTPLATVRTQAELTLLRVEKPANRQAVREMIRAIDESSRAAGQLLDHAMVSFRLEHLQARKVDLNRLAHETSDRLSPMASLRDIAIEVEGAPDPTQTQGDAILLQSALLNLLDNAIKYAPELSMVTMRVIREAETARLDVCDCGTGFPDADLPRLSHRFVRGGNTEGIVGSGLGLTIAHDVAAAHGGRLILGNNEGGGACASLVLPLV